MSSCAATLSSEADSSFCETAFELVDRTFESQSMVDRGHVVFFPIGSWEVASWRSTDCMPAAALGSLYCLISWPKRGIAFGR